MQEIKCPKCGEVFQVDESGYAAIVKQVRDKEFTQEIMNKESQFAVEKENAVQLAILEAEKAFNEKLNKKENEIAELKNKISAFDKDKELEIAKIVNEKNVELSEKTNYIAQLTSEKALTEKECQLKEQSTKDRYEGLLRLKDEEIAHYKDFKSKLLSII